MKSFKSAVLGTALSLLAFSLAPTASSAGQLRGNWSIAPSKQPGQVKFGITYRQDDDDGHSQHGSDWPVSALQGLDLATAGRHDVRFTINREAGRIEAEGFVKDGEGAGIFRFEPDSGYVPAMARLGFDDIDAEKQFAMALHDVIQEFARTVKAEDLSGLDTDKLIGFRIFDVNPQYIRELRAAGVPAREADKLMAFRVHGVTPGTVRELRKRGLELTEDQLIAFHVHEVTPEYVAGIEAQGLGRPDADQLIALRVHDVTPQYIAQMKSRGLRNLTIARIVELKVHGID
jgi:hypothetical protein